PRATSSARLRGRTGDGAGSCATREAGNRYRPSSSRPFKYSGRYAISAWCRNLFMAISSRRHRFADAPRRQLGVLEQAEPVFAIAGAVEIQRADHLVGECDAAKMAGG